MSSQIEIRIHGRGGQGTVTAAELLALAVFHEGKFTQAFPNFGVERRGAPVEAYVRISDQKIRLRSQVYEPDYLIIQDSGLVTALDLTKGLKKNGLIILNSEKKDCLELAGKNYKTVPVTKLALEILGRSVTNTGMLASFAEISGLLKFESLVKAVEEHFKGKPDLIKKNIKLMKRIIEQMK